MTTTTLVKTARTLVASVSRAAAAAETRGTLDLRTTQGGMLTSLPQHQPEQLGKLCGNSVEDWCLAQSPSNP